MIRTIAAACALFAFSAQTTGPSPQQPVFRSALDVVTVDVSVRTSGTPVAGLRAEDFVLLDNGVRQTISSIEMEEVPLDVSVLVDANEDVTIGLEHVHEDIARIAARLRPPDRLRVMTINNGIQDLVRARPAAGFPPIGRMTALHGLSTAADGIGMALMRSTGMDRRHLIIAVTNGVDAMSTLSVDSLADLARESQSVLHIVQLDVELIVPVSDPPRYSTGRQRLDGAKMGLSRVRPPTRLFWRPYDDTQNINALREAARSTGGDVHLPGLFRGGATRLFEKVFDDYRRSYLLRYTPTGVKREGWHEIRVTIPAYPGYEVTARRGYSIEAPSAPAGGRTPVASLVPRSLDPIVAAYSRADYAVFERELSRAANLATLIGDFRKAGNPWPANPAREAAFVIEIAEAALRSRRAPALDAARDLLLDYRKLVLHPLGPDGFERYWLWALLASLEGVNQPALTREFADYALTRFPEEPRFVLAGAVAVDQSRAFEAPEGRNGAASASHVRDVITRYDAAMRFAETATEARVRKAFFLHRIDRNAEALAALDGVSAPEADRDAVIGYLWRLFRGRVLEAMERIDEAKAAYASALQAQPGAQSPRVALMRLAVRTGDRPSADAIAASIQTAPENMFDPWWVYWLGDYRQYDDILNRLREQTR